ncbi:MAG: hypothetical protein EOO62_07055 [Hymenobacter sp.]|nr:MAG: hypothetical protein EOO62_07055 [Hymenobacter sp.]
MPAAADGRRRTYSVGTAQRIFWPADSERPLPQFYWPAHSYPWGYLEAITWCSATWQSTAVTLILLRQGGRGQQPHKQGPQKAGKLGVRA